MVLREGGCLCGAVRYRVEGEPEASGLCHCETCRRTASAPVLPFAMFSRARLGISRGTPREYRFSPGVRRMFCGTCGSPLFYESAGAPEHIDVMSCSLDDPGSIVPACHVQAVERIPWDRIADDRPVFQGARTEG